MPVVRWVMQDPVTSETYTVHINPNEMSSLHPKKNIMSKVTTAIDGKTMLFEGRSEPVEWQFSGAVLEYAHYDALKDWVYNKNYRIRIRDHFGRTIVCYLTGFDPTPKRSLQHYWRHQYTITAIVFSVGEPTIFDYA